MEAVAQSSVRERLDHPRHEPELLAVRPDQQMLLPADMREWLAEDDLAWFVLDAVDEIDLTPFLSDYRDDGWGRAAHDPQMMVALLLYAYATGERSSRRIERKLNEDIAFRVIAANQRPDHATIARFRVRHQDALAELFTEVLVLCRKAGLVSVGTLALDGTRIKADAADRQNRSYEQLANEILEEADAVDAAEDEEFGEKRGDELPGDRRSRKQRLRDAKRKLDQEQAVKEAELAAWEVAMAEHTRKTGYVRKNNPKKPRPLPPKATRRVNVTDPDSKPVKTATGFIQGYTAQVAAGERQVIVAAELIEGANERNRLEPMAKAAEAELAKAGVDQKPKLLLADAGYFNRPQIERLEEDGARVLRPTPTRERRRRRCDPGLTSMQCDNASKSRRPTRPTGEDSRWSSRSSPRSSHDKEPGGSREEAYPPAAPNGA